MALLIKSCLNGLIDWTVSIYSRVIKNNARNQILRIQVIVKRKNSKKHSIFKYFNKVSSHINLNKYEWFMLIRLKFCMSSDQNSNFNISELLSYIVIK
jgi:hypothetical protein